MAKYTITITEEVLRPVGSAYVGQAFPPPTTSHIEERLVLHTNHDVIAEVAKIVADKEEE